MNASKTTLTLALTAALGTATLGASGLTQAAENPFAMQSLKSGYMLAAADEKTMDGKAMDEKATEAKANDGKCGAGKCGANKKKAKAKAADGKCGAGMESKTMDGKCGAEKK